jgi:hypothetical protein
VENVGAAIGPLNLGADLMPHRLLDHSVRERRDLLRPRPEGRPETVGGDRPAAGGTEPDPDPLEELVSIVGEADGDAPRPRSSRQARVAFVRTAARKNSGRFFEAVAMRWRFGAGAGRFFCRRTCLTH